RTDGLAGDGERKTRLSAGIENPSHHAEVKAFETPDRPWPEFLVLRLEVEVMHVAGKVLGRFKLALNKCLVDDDLGGGVRQFTSLPGLHLLSHRFEVALHSIDADRN